MLLYAICGYLILKVLLQLENQTSRKGWALPATLLFMAHPVHTEVVANIKCADEILSLLLSLLTLRFTLMAWETGNGAWKWKAGLAFLAACFAKENAVTWLAVIPLTIWMFYDTPWEVFGKKVATLLWMPLLAACIFILVGGVVLHWTFGKEADVLINNPFIKWDGAHWIPFSWAERSAAILFSLGKYFQLLIFPHPLTHDYYPRQIGMPGWGDWQVWFSAILLVALAVWSLMGIRTRKFSAFTILYYGITLSVVSNIFFPVGTNLSERFVFMPSLGFCMLAGWGLSQIKAEKTRWIVLVLVLLLYSVKTTLRNTVWKDNITLATADIGTSANSAKLNNSLAAQLTERALKLSQPGERKAQTDKAIGYFTRAIEINPAYIEALYGRGSAWFVQGNSFNALKDFLAAEQISAAYPNLRNNLALAFRESAKTLIQNNGDRATILAYLKEAQKRFPSDPEINTLLAQFSQ